MGVSLSSSLCIKNGMVLYHLQGDALASPMRAQHFYYILRLQLKMLLILFLVILRGKPSKGLLLLGPSVIKYAFSAVILASIIMLEPLAARQLRSFDITCGLQTIMQCCLVLLIIVSKCIADLYCLELSCLFLAIEFSKLII